MKQQHTPGPWATSAPGLPLQVECSEGFLVAQCNVNGSIRKGSLLELEANARLIAAAPTMVSELEKLHRFLGRILETEPDGDVVNQSAELYKSVESTLCAALSED